MYVIIFRSHVAEVLLMTNSCHEMLVTYSWTQNTLKIPLSIDIEERIAHAVTALST